MRRRKNEGLGSAGSDVAGVGPGGSVGGGAGGVI